MTRTDPPAEASAKPTLGELDLEDDRWPVTPEERRRLVEKATPAEIVRWFEAKRRPSLRFAAVLAEHAEAIAEALAAQGEAESSLIADLPPAAQARFLDRLAASDHQPSAHALRSFSGAAALAPAAYTTLVERALKAMSQRDAGDLFLEPGALDATQIERLLTAARAKDKLFRRVSLLVAVHGTPACATALAAFAGDTKHGKRCARLLAAMGAPGREAARAAIASPPNKAKEAALAGAHLDKILSLPATGQFLQALIAGSAVQSLDITTFRVTTPPAPKTEAVHPPIPLDAAERALSGDPIAPADLPPHHWADLLHIVAEDLRPRDIPRAHALASHKGLLGRGADPGSLFEAVGRFNFDFYVKDPYKSPVGLFSMLLGAGAPPEVLLHAMAVFAAVPANRTLGQTGRHFDLPLKAFKPPRHEAWRVLTRHLELTIFHGKGADELSRWPELHRATDVPLAAPWTSPAPLLHFRLRARVEGASSVTVTLRKRVTLTVDIKKERWKQKGLSGKKAEGPTAPPGDPAIIELEVYRNAMRFGVGGANVGDPPDGYLFEGVGKDEGPVVIAAKGEGARLVEVILTENRSMRDASDIVDVLADEDMAKIKDVAGTESAFGALALAAEASLGEGEEARAAAEKALIGMGAQAKPWLDALGLAAGGAKGKEKAKASKGALRSFEEVLADFVAGQAKKKPLKRATLDSGVLAASFGNPASPKWKSGVAVSEDTVYLLPPDHYSSETAMDGPEELIGALSGLPTVTTWNTKGDGESAGKKKEWWIVSTSELVQEQDDDYNTMSLTVAAWRVKEGVAMAVFRAGGEPLGKLMDLPEGWPRRQDFQSFEVWIGE